MTPTQKACAEITRLGAATVSFDEAQRTKASADWSRMSPVLQEKVPPGRYRLGQQRGNEDLTKRHLAYFGSESGQEEASPPHILERGEQIEAPPALLLKGAADEAVPEGDAERFAELYGRAGGLIELGKYPGEPHGFMRQDTPNAARAFALAKSFIQRQVTSN